MWRGSYKKAQTTERAHFIEFLHQLCSGIEEPIQTNGRPRLPLADIILGLVYKVYTGVSGRRFASDLRDALGEGYISKMPSYNSVFDYFKNGITYAISETVDCPECRASEIHRNRIRGR